MKVAKLEMIDGSLKETNIKTIDCSQLTSECWGIQMWGIEHCEECEFKDTDDCGGKAIRERLLKEKP